MRPISPLCLCPQKPVSQETETRVAEIRFEPDWTGLSVRSITAPPGDDTTAIFRQVNQEYKRLHHDALEFPDGQTPACESKREACYGHTSGGHFWTPIPWPCSAPLELDSFMRRF
jgi:hypothetical protein